MPHLAMLIVACARVHACLLLYLAVLSPGNDLLKRVQRTLHAGTRTPPYTTNRLLDYTDCAAPACMADRRENVNAAPNLPAGQGRRERLEPS